MTDRTEAMDNLIAQDADLIDVCTKMVVEVTEALARYRLAERAGHINEYLGRFIIAKPDPLVEVLHEVDTGPEWDSPEDYCNKIRAALEARGLEIREKSNDD